MAEEVQKESFTVSSAHPDKILVNGVDLVNRAELSTSQNRELQRFIDNHSFQLLDRPKNEKEVGPDGAYYGGKYDISLNRNTNINDYDSGRRTNTDSLNRIGSPYSDYGTKGSRKGVSFADDGSGARARSHSPSHGRSSGYGSNYDPYGSSAGLNSRDGTYDSRRGAGNYGAGNYGAGNYGNSPASTYDRNSTADRRPASARGAGGRQQYDQSLRSRTESPHSQFKWKPYSSYDPDYERKTIAPPYPEWLKDRKLTASYSSLSRHPDNYNRYETEKYLSRINRSSREKDEEIKFYGFGDRLGSGIELARKRWTGGELITDPFYYKKSLKPRTMFYSPIGDGTVAADGIELKRGPPDLDPKIHVTHERVIERGDPGKAGRRVYEKTWDTGGRGADEDDGNRNGNWPDDGGRGAGWPDDGANRGGDDGNRGRGDNGPKYPAIDSGPRYPVAADDGWPKDRGDPFAGLGDGDGYPRATPLSFNGGTPREGWTKTFIINPRELINQYGEETLTTIFDLEDHTPKTLTTTKEVISEVRAA